MLRTFANEVFPSSEATVLVHSHLSCNIAHREINRNNLLFSSDGFVSVMSVAISSSYGYQALYQGYLHMLWTQETLGKHPEQMKTIII